MVKLAVIVLAGMLLAACGEKVSVPPAHKGIVLHTSGYEGEFLPPSRFRLPVCWIWEQCPKLVIISVQDQAITETMDLFLPQSDINLDDVEANMRLSVTDNESTLRALLNKVSPVTTEGGYLYVSFDEIYRIYGKERVRATARQGIAAKKLEWLLANRESYGNEVFRMIDAALKGIKSPIQIKQFSFAKLQPPQSMRDAFLKAKEREIALQQAEANKLVSIKEAEAALEVAEKTAAVRLVRAQAFADEAAKMSEAITQPWLQMRRLEVLEAMAANQSAVFIPADMDVDTAVSLEQLQKLKAIAGQ